MLRLLLSIWFGKAIFFLTRFLKKGGGSAAPGLYALKLDPKLVQKLASQIPQNIVITGTNGKTTTARILNDLITAQKIKTIRNVTGSNLERGIASTLLSKVNLWGKIEHIDVAIWETDEAAFNSVLPKLKPSIIIFLNAFRDQLDRYGEVDSVVKKWQKSLEKVSWDPQILLNANDRNIVKMGQSLKHNLAYFTLEKVGFIGEEGLEKEIKLPQADFSASIKKTKGLEGQEVLIKYPGGQTELDFKVAGAYHVFDLVAAFATYYQLNLPVSSVAETLKTFTPAFGRVEQVTFPKAQGYIFLIKNPVGASLVFETISSEISEKDALLVALNDNFADGVDISWIWDAQVEILKTAKKYPVFISGKRADDLALRFKYADFSTETLTIQPDLSQALEQALQKTEGKLFILPTYTALLELQKILAQKGIKQHYWKES